MSSSSDLENVETVQIWTLFRRTDFRNIVRFVLNVFPVLLCDVSLAPVPVTLFQACGNLLDILRSVQRMRAQHTTRQPLLV